MEDNGSWLPAIEEITRRKMAEYAAEIRQRLLVPPNAVPDQGIDLKRHRQLPPLEPLSAPQPKKVPPPPSPIIPFPTPRSSVMRIVELVAKHTGEDIKEIFGKRRKEHLCLARHIAIYLCRKHFPGRSLTSLGSFFKKDHTSIMFACKRINRDMPTQTDIGILIRVIITRVEADMNRE